MKRGTNNVSPVLPPLVAGAVSAESQGAAAPRSAQAAGSARSCSPVARRKSVLAVARFVVRDVAKKLLVLNEPEIAEARREDRRRRRAELQAVLQRKQEAAAQRRLELRLQLQQQRQQQQHQLSSLRGEVSMQSTGDGGSAATPAPAAASEWRAASVTAVPLVGDGTPASMLTHVASGLFHVSSALGGEHGASDLSLSKATVARGFSGVSLGAAPSTSSARVVDPAALPSSIAGVGAAPKLLPSLLSGVLASSFLTSAANSGHRPRLVSPSIFDGLILASRAPIIACASRTAEHGAVAVAASPTSRLVASSAPPPPASTVFEPRAAHRYQRLLPIGQGACAQTFLVQWMPPVTDVVHRSAAATNRSASQGSPRGAATTSVPTTPPRAAGHSPWLGAVHTPPSRPENMLSNAGVASAASGSSTPAMPKARPPAEVSSLSVTQPTVSVMVGGISGFGGHSRVVSREHLFVCKCEPLSAIKHRTTLLRSDETDVLSNCAHPNIVAYVDQYDTATEHNLIMEFVDGGDLASEVRRRLNAGAATAKHFSDTTIDLLFSQMCLAVEYLHRHNILHRDLKLANVLVSRKLIVKLADFGFAKQSPWVDVDAGHVSQTALGTPYYMAPETYRGVGYSEKADVWALGVMLYELLCLRLPFPGDTVEEVRERVVHENPKRVPIVTLRRNAAPLPDVVARSASGSDRSAFRAHRALPAMAAASPWLIEMASIVDACLAQDPSSRPTAAQLLRLPVIRAACAAVERRFRECALESQLPVDRVWCAVLREHLRIIDRDGRAPVPAGAGVVPDVSQLTGELPSEASGGASRRQQSDAEVFSTVGGSPSDSLSSTRFAGSASLSSTARNTDSASGPRNASSQNTRRQDSAVRRELRKRRVQGQSPAHPAEGAGPARATSDVTFPA
jgi:serine/threonine protein kinase